MQRLVPMLVVEATERRTATFHAASKRGLVHTVVHRDHNHVIRELCHALWLFAGVHVDCQVRNVRLHIVPVEARLVRKGCNT